MLLDNTHKNFPVSLMYALLGCIVSYAVLSNHLLLVGLLCILILSFTAVRNIDVAYIVFCVLPIAVLTGFIDISVIPLPTFETPIGIALDFLMLIFMLLVLKDDIKLPNLSFVKPFGLYFLVLILSSLLSTDQYRSFGYMAKTYVPLTALLTLLTIVFASNASIKVFEKYFAVSYVILFVVAAYQYQINGLGFTEAPRALDNVIELKNLGDNIRVPSLFKHTYAFVEYNMFVFPFVFTRLLSTVNIKEKFIVGTLSLMILLTTVWTQQRVGLAIIFFQLIAIYIYKNYKNKNFLVTSVKLCLAVSIVALFIFKTEYGEALIMRIINTFFNPHEVTRDIGSTLQRVWRIQIAWEIFKDYPLFGSGLATSPELFVQYGWDYINAAGGPHNLYLLLLSETGIFAFITFICAWLIVIKQQYHFLPVNKEKAFAVVIFLITVLLDGLFTGLLSGLSIVILVIVFSYSHALNTVYIQGIPNKVCPDAM